MSNVRVTINPERGWFASLPKATQDFIQRKVTKAQTDRRFPVEVSVTGSGAMRAHFAHRPTQARLDQAEHMGAVLARDFRTVPAWRGASEGR
jgi:hypothetical protein